MTTGPSKRWRVKFRTKSGAIFWDSILIGVKEDLIYLIRDQIETKRWIHVNGGEDGAGYDVFGLSATIRTSEIESFTFVEAKKD